MTAKTFLNKILEKIVIVLTMLLCLVVIWQVITRFLFNNPSSWSEEVSRYLLIWITFLGGSIGLLHGSHMSLVVLTGRIQNKTAIKMALHIFAYAVCCLVGYVFVRYGIIYMKSGMNRSMMCCNFPLGYIYAVIPISGVIIILNCIEIIVRDILSAKRTQEKEA